MNKHVMYFWQKYQNKAYIKVKYGNKKIYKQ